MKSRILTSFFLIVPTVLLFSQIQNGGFEDYSSLPNSLGQFNNCIGWDNGGSSTGSPDYYHYSGTMAGDIPETPVAYVDSWEGFAIMGATFYHSAHPNYREYISSEFTSPLTPGDRYLVSFSLTNGQHTPLSNAGLAISDIGVAFTVGPVTQIDNEALNLQVIDAIDTVFYSKSWKRINFIVSADQAYTHFNFGVFGDDITKTVELRDGNSPTIAYYFMDDFRMIEVDDNFSIDQVTYNNSVPVIREDEEVPPSHPSIEYEANGTQLFIPNAFSPNMDGDNDTFKPVCEDLMDYQFEIFSRWGELLFSTNNSVVGWDGSVNGNNVAADVYVWQLSYTESNSEDSLKKKTIHGTVNLIK